MNKLKHERHALLRKIASDNIKIKRDAAQLAIDALAIEYDLNRFIKISNILEEGKNE